MDGVIRTLTIILWIICVAAALAGIVLVLLSTLDSTAEIDRSVADFLLIASCGMIIVFLSIIVCCRPTRFAIERERQKLQIKFPDTEA